MKNMYKLALLAALGLGSITAAQAQQAAGDLILGFDSNPSSTDLVIDLGQIPTTADTTLATGIDLSQFGSASVLAGVIAGVPFTSQLWTTELRTGTAVTSYTQAGTEAKPVNISKNNGASAVGLPSGVALGSTPTTLTDLGAWDQIVFNNNTHWSSLVGNPSSTLTGTELDLDLWTTTATGNTKTGNAFTYAGDLQINLSGTTASVVWDPTVSSPVPEPATYGLLSGAGMLLLGLRRQLGRKA